MSSIVERAAIMAPPPNSQQAAEGPSILGVAIPAIPNMIFLGGLMFVGGKVAGWAWDYVSEYMQTDSGAPEAENPDEEDYEADGDDPDEDEEEDDDDEEEEEEEEEEEGEDGDGD